MAERIQPKADQPRVTTENLKRGEASPSVQYRVTNTRTPNRMSSRNDGRMSRS